MSPPGSDLDDDEISLRPYLQTLWRYRQVLATATAAAAVLFGIVTLALMALLPSDRTASLEFRLTFANADKGLYPNGSPFNAAAITAEPVVSQVFAANELERYVSLDELERTLSVDRSSDAIRRLDAELQARLSNTRAADDRLSLESNYRAMRDAILEPQFELRLHRTGRLVEIPEPIIEKALSDVLETWAMRADATGGVNRPDIDPVSREMLARATDAQEPYLIRIEVMRSGAQRLMTALNALAAIPGARAVRIAGNRSIADEVAAVEELTSIDLESLTGMIRVAPVSPRERIVLNAYFSRLIATARLNRDTTATRARTLQTVLREYMAQREDRFDIRPQAVQPGTPDASASAPGLSEIFVKQVMTLAAAAQDREFEYRRVLSELLVTASAQEAAATRQINYYQDLLSQLSTPSAASAALSSELPARFNAAHERLLGVVDRVAALNRAVSSEILNPAGRLYTVTSPVRLQTVPGISTQLLLMRFALTVIVTFIVACVACLIRGSQSPATPAPTGRPSLEART